jgi:hypothetical protein
MESDPIQSPNELPAPPPKRRSWLKVIGIVALVITGLAVVGLLIGPEVAPNGPLFEEDFAQAPYSLSTDSDRFVELTVVDQRYRATIKDGSPPQLVRHVFTHSHGSLSFEASVTYPADTGAAFASVGCWGGESAYVLLMTSESEVGLLETIRESTGERQPLTDLIAQEAARPGRPNRLRIECVGGGTGPTVVSGYLNGEPVLSVAVPDGYDSFDAVGFFLAAEQGGSFWIDDLIARDERPRPAMSPVPPIDPNEP